jgi:GYF domain 2
MEAPLSSQPPVHSDSWFYNLDGVALGPFSTKEMENQFEKGTLPPDTLIWCPEQTQWLPLSESNPSWNQISPETILQPGPLRIPLPPQNKLPALSAPPIPSDAPQPTRGALKPVAHSSKSSGSETAKGGFLKRLISRNA